MGLSMVRKSSWQRTWSAGKGPTQGRLKGGWHQLCANGCGLDVGVDAGLWVDQASALRFKFTHTLTHSHNRPM
jgi:hypothetical protein